jgi:hypothetical protein
MKRTRSPASTTQRRVGDHTLDAELQKILDAVGQERYGAVTARLFAPGGKFGPKIIKHRYALT